LRGFEQVLRVLGPIQHDPLFRRRSFLVLGTNARKARNGAVGIVRATRNSVLDSGCSAGPFGAAPGNTMPSISPGMDWMDASPAAPPPKLALTTGTVFAPCAFR